MSARELHQDLCADAGTHIPRSPQADAETCDLCGEIIPQEDVSVEAFEIAGCLACTGCLETLAEQGERHERACAY